MKKILAVLSVVGVATVLTGCNNMKVDNYQQNIQEFKEKLSTYTAINKVQSAKVNVGNFLLKTNIPETNLDTQKNDEVPSVTIEENNENLQGNTLSEPETIEPTTQENTENEIKPPMLDVGDKEIKPQENTQDVESETINEQVSTLYSVSDKIDDCCEDFVTLKQNLTDAISETQRLIEKVNKKEIELTAEQKLLITEQSKQLKNLGRQLSRSTTELAISLSDLNDLMLKNGDINDLSIKYMVVLDNLVNGNEMLENGLYSLGLINSMFNASSQLPPNNTGRILYGFRRNNEQPVVKDYLIDKDGNITENKTDEDKTDENKTEDKDEKTNIDTMQNNSKMNVDSFRNNNRNIDSFFNTALLDNEFMYGNGYGYGPMGNGLMYGYGNTNGNAYPNQNIENTNNNGGVFNNDNTQHLEQTEQKQAKKKHRKFKISKNIDSYKTAETPTLSTRFNSVKKAISGFFNKFQKRPKENPVFRFNPNEDNSNE